MKQSESVVRKDPPRAREKSFAEEVIKNLEEYSRCARGSDDWLQGYQQAMAGAVDIVRRIDRRRKRREGRKGK